MKNFECHVVFKPNTQLEKDSALGIAQDHKFSISFLKGDEDLGDDKLMYCTIRDETFESIKSRMDAFIEDIQNPFKYAAKVLRAKIEVTLYDKRY